jgi:protein transport protein SEC61 subunit alpha
VIYFAFPASLLTKLTGRWETPTTGSFLRPVDGFPYYLSCPTSLRDVLLDPFHAMFYLVLMLAFVATVAKIWIEISGTNARGVAKDLREKQMMIKGHRGGNLEHELNRNIPTAAAFGGMAVGGLAVVADMFGSAVSGAGVVMLVTIVFQYYEIGLREHGGMFSNLLGE